MATLDRPEDYIQELVQATKQKNGKSVQGREQGSEWFNTPGMVSSFLFPIAALADSIPAWGYYPLIRDKYLRTFSRTEPYFQGATYSMSAFAKSLNLKLTQGGTVTKNYAQDIINYCENGRGARSLIQKSAYDLFTTDNGFFWELVGSGKPDKPLKGKLLPPYVLHMDSLHCWRTLDEEFPVVYVNPIDGTYHYMHYTRVLFRSSNEQPDELARGIGFCAASRILRYTQKMRDILVYQHEKVAGNFTRALGLLKGMNAFELSQADTQAREAAMSSGFARYRGIPFLGKAGMDIDAKIVDLASIGDGFDPETEKRDYVFCLALAYGVDAREFYPATTSGATKGDASIQDMKTQDKGKGDIIETFESAWRDVFPDTLEIEYDNPNDERDKMHADINAVHVTYFMSLKSTSIIDADEARAHLIAEGVLDPELLKATSPEQQNAKPVTEVTPTEVEGAVGLEGELTLEGDNPDEQPNANTQQDAKTDTNVDKAGANSQDVSNENLKKKDLAATEEAFNSAFTNIINGAVAGDYTRAQAQRQLARLLQRTCPQGYVDGLSDGGVEISSPDELERDDQRMVEKMLNAQGVFVNDLMATVYSDDGITNAQADIKSQQWFSGSVLPFYQAGLQASGIDPMMEFVGDDGKESCEDCKRLKGQRHRLSDWVDRGFDPPNGDNLACHDGHLCQHRLEKVRGRERGSW